MGYRSKSISLEDEVWKAFDAARSVHGSYNKLLKYVLSAGGVFEPQTNANNWYNKTTEALVVKPHSLHSGTRPIKGCAECTALKEKK